MSKPRRAFTPEEKVAILRRHLLEKTPVSDLCDQFQILPTQFYQWQKQFFEQGGAAFRLSAPAEKRLLAEKDQQIAALQSKLQRKHEVLSELMEEHVQLKKELGEP